MPKGRKVVGSRWVHTYKSDGHGNCLKTKSRVVAKGFSSSGCRLSRDNVPHARISARKNDSSDCERERFARFSP